jgi:hypothetical protein
MAFNYFLFFKKCSQIKVSIDPLKGVWMLILLRVVPKKEVLMLLIGRETAMNNMLYDIYLQKTGYIGYSDSLSLAEPPVVLRRGEMSLILLSYTGSPIGVGDDSADTYSFRTPLFCLSLSHTRSSLKVTAESSPHQKPG